MAFQIWCFPLTGVRLVAASFLTAASFNATEPVIQPIPAMDGVEITDESNQILLNGMKPLDRHTMFEDEIGLGPFINNDFQRWF